MKQSLLIPKKKELDKILSKVTSVAANSIKILEQSKSNLNAVQRCKTIPLKKHNNGKS